MTNPLPVVRRTFLRWLAAGVSAFALPLSSRGAFGQANDRGIGGTGAPGATEQENQDRGIGGTGVIGTIRKFGSIVVNGLRITYAKTIPIWIDGRAASASQLRIGHVVRVVADQRGGLYSTHAIDVVSEVVGDIDSVSGNFLVVLGQTIWTGNLAKGHWAVGDHVAVSGLRRPDGLIIASLIERRSGTVEQVAGPIVQASDGSLRIGSLRLMGVDAAMIGQRAVLTGKFVGDAFAVDTNRDELGILRSQAHRVLVESYIEYNDGGLYTGSGFAIAGLSTTQPAPRKTVRAIISATFNKDGTLHLDSLRIEPSSNSHEDEIPELPTNPSDHGGSAQPGGASPENSVPDNGRHMGAPGDFGAPPFSGPPGGSGSFGPGGGSNGGPH